MRVVILGAGAVGIQIARQLVEENRDVVLIERNASVARSVSERLDCLVLNDEGNSLEVLKKAQVDKADFFIAVSQSDEVNMITCGLVSSEYPGVKTIARVRNIDYSYTRIVHRGFLGIDLLVNPEIEAADAAVRSIQHGATSDIMVFDQPNVQMRSLAVEAGSLFVDRKLSDIAGSLDIRFLVAVIVRDKNYIVPSGETWVREGDVLYIVAEESTFDALFTRVGRSRTPIRKIVILGGGKVGAHIARRLLERKGRGGRQQISRLFSRSALRSVKIVDRNPETCKALHRDFPSATVINADISQEGLFEDEQFSNADLVVAATDNEELNIVSGIYAKSLGTRRSVVLINKKSYMTMASSLSVDVPISVKASVVGTILKFIRRGNVKSVHSISDGRVEVIEFSVDEGSRALGKSIQDARLPPGSLIVSAMRDGKAIIPDGTYRFLQGDHAIVLARNDAIERVQELFAR